MAKRDVMDIWSALQWAVRDQKADKAFAANDDHRMMVKGGSVTGAVMRMGELNARIDGGGAVPGVDLDPDAERIWMAVLFVREQWRQGGLRGMIGVDLTPQMARAMHRMARNDHINPVHAAIDAARIGEMPHWYRAGDGVSRREVEESRLYYVLVWDVLAVLYTTLSACDSMGIVIEMPSIARLPWRSRKKVLDACA